MLHQVHLFSGINFLYLFVNLILVPVPLFPTHLFLHLWLLPLDSPLCSSVTPYLFHFRLKTYLFHKSYPHVVSLLPPGLASLTFARTISSELLDFCF